MKDLILSDSNVIHFLLRETVFPKATKWFPVINSVAMSLMELSSDFVSFLWLVVDLRFF